MTRQLDRVLDTLDRYHQRATYGAVGGVVNAETLVPTGYIDDEMHPALRERQHVIKSADALAEWLRDPK